MKSKWKKSAKEKKGILIGADKTSEWLLPWWWSRYREHNAFPVIFFDFGMSDEMRQWCAERGQVLSIDLESDDICSRNRIDPELANHWEKNYGWKLWNMRRTWFKKPFAFLESPYEKGIWIDLDCEVLGSLESLFLELDPSSELAFAKENKERFLSLDSRARYNAGVVVFQHGASIIEKWAEGALTKNHLFGGSDSLLSHLIQVHRISVGEFPEIYNWQMTRGFNLEAVILHWVGNGGKSYIRDHGGLKPSLDVFYHSWKGL